MSRMIGGGWMCAMLLSGGLLTASALAAEAPEKRTPQASDKATEPTLAPPEHIARMQVFAHRREEIDAKRYGAELAQKIRQQYETARTLPLRTGERRRALEKLMAEYPQSNWAGCACLSLAEMSDGPEAVKYYQAALDRFSACWLPGGAQVGPLALRGLILRYRLTGATNDAKALEEQLRTGYPDAISIKGYYVISQLDATQPPARESRPR